MTSNPRPTPATAPDIKLPPVKAEALRDQTLATAGLGSLNPDATLIVFAAALLAESEDGYTPQAAAGILQRARKVSLEMLGAAANQVTREMGPAMLAFWRQFVKDTWQDASNPPPSYVDVAVVARRKEAEEQEQERNRQNATRYADNVKITIDALKIDEKEFPQMAEPSKPRAPRIDVGQLLHNLIYKPAGAPGQAASTAPGWLTPPLINPSDEDITIFDNDIMEIVVVKKLSGEPAWKKLEDRGFERRRIVQAIFNVRKTAQAQMAQCDQILTVIRTDYEQHIEPVIKAATLLGHAVSVVNAFYGPLLATGGDAMPAPRPVAPRPPSPPRPRGR